MKEVILTLFLPFLALYSISAHTLRILIQLIGSVNLVTYEAVKLRLLC